MVGPSDVGEDVGAPFESIFGVEGELTEMGIRVSSYITLAN